MSKALDHLQFNLPKNWFAIHNIYWKIITVYLHGVFPWPLSKPKYLTPKPYPYIRLKRYKRDFPGGAVVDNPPANAGDMGSSPGLGRSHIPRSSWAREP